jgi:hypothetical protein
MQSQVKICKRKFNLIVHKTGLQLRKVQLK